MIVLPLHYARLTSVLTKGTGKGVDATLDYRHGEREFTNIARDIKFDDAALLSRDLDRRDLRVLLACWNRATLPKTFHSRNRNPRGVWLRGKIPFAFVEETIEETPPWLFFPELGYFGGNSGRNGGQAPLRQACGRLIKAGIPTVLMSNGVMARNVQDAMIVITVELAPFCNRTQ
jgi:hypothetical protein